MKKYIFSCLLACITITSYSQQYTLDGELIITDKTTASGGADVDGDLNLLGVEQPQEDYKRILFVDENGKVQPLNDAMLRALFEGMYTTVPVGLDNCDDYTTNPAPTWASAPGVIYAASSDCYTVPDVGVGTNTPLHRLHVQGRSYFTNNAGIGVEPTASSMLNIQNSGGNFLNKGITLSMADLNETPDQTGYYLSMTGAGVNSRGLAIDVDSPDMRTIVVAQNGTDVFKVDGNGAIWTTSVHVQMTPFPDYVFDPERKLMSISELERYIKEHKRLPNMPSAEEVDKNGVNLGELNRLLVEKVEELTLYVIELHERIEVLESENEK